MGKHSASGKQAFGGDGPGAPRRRKPVRRAVPSSVRKGAKLTGPRPRPGVDDDDYSLSDPRSRRRGPLESAPERLRVERDRRKARTKRIISIVAASVVAILVFGAAGVYAYAKHIERTMQRTVYKQEKLELDLKKAAPQKPFTILLMGYDKRPKEKVYRSDTLILARIDPKTKQVWMISIPRDTKVEIPGHGTRKFNDAYALGGEKLAIKTVEQYTDVPINHFVGVDFEGFKSAVDAMGGVWIDVPVEINDIKADRSYKHRAAHIDAGYQRLDGEHALTFVRTRHTYVDQDFGRMRNQQAFFKAVADQIATRVSVARLPKIISSVAPYISTDMSLMEMMRTAQALKSAGSKRVYTATFEGDWVSPYVVTNESKKATLLAKFDAGEPFVKVKSSEASGSADATGSAKPKTPKPSQISVTVRNGAGIAGCAKQAASILKAQSFKVGEVGNAGQFVYDKTTVVYKTNEAAAKLVASTLPPGTKIVESRGMYSFKTTVLVVVGKNWDVSKVPVAPIKTQ